MSISESTAERYTLADPDVRLMLQVRDGDAHAFEELMLRYQNRLLSLLAHMVGQRDLAEDLAQEVFLRVFRARTSYVPGARFSTWLFTIAKRLYVNACQKHKPAYDSDTVGMAAGSWRGPEAPTIETEVNVNAKAAIDFALASLSEDQREIVVLFHQLDWPIAQIAEYMDMPEGTVKSHLHRGRMRMRSALEAHEKFSAHVEEVWT